MKYRLEVINSFDGNNYPNIIYNGKSCRRRKHYRKYGNKSKWIRKYQVNTKIVKYDDLS